MTSLPSRSRVLARRVRRPVALTILLAALVAGCGSDSSTGATSDSSWIVYSWDGTCGSSPPGASETQGLCLVRSDGTESHRILRDLVEETGLVARWSQARLHRARRQGCGAYLDVVDLETGATRIVVAGTAETNAWAPRWSPDGSSLTFNVEHVTDGTFDGSVVATASASGGAVTVVTPKELAYAGYPDWSPDGTSIVFATYGIGEFPTGGEGAPNLYAVAPDGSGLRQITRYAVDGPRAGWATWTPDGTQVVFTRVDRAGARRIALVAPDGRGLRVVDGIRANMPRVQP